MLAIRMQRTGRSGHAQFRVIVQDSRFSPKRGRVVSYLGNYNPHTKVATIDSDKAAEYLKNGAQPSDTVARLFKKEGIKLPAWVNISEPKKRTVRNPEKRRSTAPAKPADSAPAEETSEETTEEAAAPETPPQQEKTPAEPETPVEDNKQATESEPESPPEEKSDTAEQPDQPG